METFGGRLDRYQGVGPGFHFLRLALAILVVFFHSFLIVMGNFDYIDQHNLWTIFGAVIPMFFALSGFLVSASAQRQRLKDFLLNRGLRIVPALAVDIMVSALIIGPAFTTLSLHGYFDGKDFHHYFANIFGFIHYTLPGVFPNNPFANQVNGSLWTVPFEIGCYMLIALLLLSGAIKSKGRIFFSFVVFTAVFFGLHIYYHGHPSPLAEGSMLGNYLGNFIGDRGSYHYFDFLAGALLYFFRGHIPYSGKLALACVALIVLNGLWYDEANAYFFSLPMAYLTVYIGLCEIPKLPIYSRGDYSYGIYLYAYPLQQALVCLFPGKFTVTAHFLLSAVLATFVAIFSWHYIEKPALSLRKNSDLPPGKTRKACRKRRG